MRACLCGASKGRPLSFCSELALIARRTVPTSVPGLLSAYHASRNCSSKLFVCSTYENEHGPARLATSRLSRRFHSDCHICVLLRWTNPTQETFYPTSSSYLRDSVSFRSAGVYSRLGR